MAQKLSHKDDYQNDNENSIVQPFHRLFTNPYLGILFIPKIDFKHKGSSCAFNFH